MAGTNRGCHRGASCRRGSRPRGPPPLRGHQDHRKAGKREGSATPPVCLPRWAVRDLPRRRGGRQRHERSARQRAAADPAARRGTGAAPVSGVSTTRSLRRRALRGRRDPRAGWIHPREQPVKDLVDLALIARSQRVDGPALRTALLTGTAARGHASRPPCSRHSSPVACPSTSRSPRPPAARRHGRCQRPPDASKHGSHSSWPLSRRTRVSMIFSPQAEHVTEAWIRAFAGGSPSTGFTS